MLTVEQQKNLYGEILDSKLINKPRKKEYMNESGIPKFGKMFSDHSDSNGFDIRHDKEDIVPKPEEIFVRFGNDNGYFLTTLDSSYEQLSMPYELDTVPFHVYKVNPLYNGNEKISFEKGIVAPDFEQSGGGIQFFTGTKSVFYLIKIKFLLEITSDEYFKIR